MKFLFCVRSVLLFNSNCFSQEGRPAADLLQEAFVKSKKEEKNILVILTASWCTPCKEFKRGLYDVYNATFFSDNYVIQELHTSEIESKKSLNNPGADSVFKKYRGEIREIPYWVILSPEGKLLHKELGFSSHAEDLKIFIGNIKKTSHLKEWELQMIYERLRVLSHSVLD